MGDGMSEKSASWQADNLGQSTKPQGFIRHHPSELMLRSVLSGRYCSTSPEITPQTRVLDIGCMYLNNLIPFHDRGCACTGVEINADMLAISRSAAEAQGLAIALHEGRNQALPFEANSFDLLLAINVIHYEDDGHGLKAALREYHRVLAPAGRAFIVSAGPEHYLRASAERLGPNQFRIAYSDFRRGQVMAYFDDLQQMKMMMGEVFDPVSTGRLMETHDQASVDFFYGMGVKG